MEVPPIFFWISDDCAWARVVGPGTLRNSTALKDFCKKVINRGYRTIVIDLAECPEVDSTFMGTCAFVALRLRQLGVGTLRVTNVNADVVKLFQSLGLDQLFEIELAD
ncbi:STAS domain-containing protein [Verrucomicrobiota bacterium sgz303538]